MRPRQFFDDKDDGGREQRPTVGIDPDDLRALSNVFAAPKWLRDLGLASWLLAGVTIVLVGIVWFAALTATIVDPVLVGLVIATVASPLVGFLKAHRVPRAAGAAIVLLLIVAVAVLIALLVIGGITSQSATIREQAAAAAPKAQNWLKDLGESASGASGATSELGSALPKVISTLVHGLVHGITGLASFAFGLSFTALAIFFLLKDGPGMRAWVEGRMGVSQSVARIVTKGVMLSLRRYFLGVTMVAAFNGVIVGLGALVLDVPLAGTIAVVSFVTAYVPFIGAFVAGAFAVILALGAKGTTTAIIMLVIVLLANGLLQNVFQPIAFGATLKLNPLVVLVVTIGAGCLFGMIGLILAAPLTSAARQIAAELGKARAAVRPDPPPDAPEPVPA
ncbi:MAG TPA: AI-2E family transporter [Gaiellaceae bacterium]|jgi:predicted PurR-regulated permease PerM|nr:AI-2E family transporter [Gaiellaceae bacterium]